MAKIREADLGGQSPMGKGDKAFQLAKEVATLAGRGDIVDGISKAQQVKDQISSLKEDGKRVTTEEDLEAGGGGESVGRLDVSGEATLARNLQRVQKTLRVAEEVAKLTGQKGITVLLRNCKKSPEVKKGTRTRRCG